MYVYCIYLYNYIYIYMQYTWLTRINDGSSMVNNAELRVDNRLPWVRRMYPQKSRVPTVERFDQRGQDRFPLVDRRGLAVATIRRDRGVVGCLHNDSGESIIWYSKSIIYTDIVVVCGCLHKAIIYIWFM